MEIIVIVLISPTFVIFGYSFITILSHYQVYPRVKTRCILYALFVSPPKQTYACDVATLLTIISSPSLVLRETCHNFVNKVKKL